MICILKKLLKKLTNVIDLSDDNEFVTLYGYYMENNK